MVGLLPLLVGAGLAGCALADEAAGDLDALGLLQQTSLLSSSQAAESRTRLSFQHALTDLTELKSELQFIYMLLWGQSAEEAQENIVDDEKKLMEQCKLLRYKGSVSRVEVKKYEKDVSRWLNSFTEPGDFEEEGVTEGARKEKAAKRKVKGVCKDLEAWEGERFRVYNDISKSMFRDGGRGVTPLQEKVRALKDALLEACTAHGPQEAEEMPKDCQEDRFVGLWLNDVNRVLKIIEGAQEGKSFKCLSRMAMTKKEGREDPECQWVHEGQVGRYDHLYDLSWKLDASWYSAFFAEACPDPSADADKPARRHTVGSPSLDSTLPAGAGQGAEVRRTNTVSDANSQGLAGGAVVKGTGIDDPEARRKIAKAVDDAFREHYTDEASIARQIKGYLDSALGPLWHVHVGADYSMYITNLSGQWMHVQHGSFHIFVFQTSGSDAAVRSDGESDGEGLEELRDSFKPSHH